MANAFRDYEAVGSTDTSRARGAALTDLVIGALAGVLVWPFPVLRIVFRGMAGSEAAGWAIHVPVLLLFMATSAWVCSALLFAVGHRSVGMYFSDFGFPEPPGLGAALAAACPWTLAGVAGLVGVRGPAVRFAEARLRSTGAGQRRVGE